uniref:Uncharacterized protein n=1 Tax=Rhizophora mucronata TaxID=61149 RepID=A0A2P2LMD1_RHIMU
MVLAAMADSTKVRLVRCPKCENLLPELVDYSVYQCGGCGAVLRAKAKNRDANASSEKIGEEGVSGAPIKILVDSLEKESVDPSDASDLDVKSDSSASRCDEKKTEKNDLDDASRCRNQSKSMSGKLVCENGSEEDMNKDKLSHPVGRDDGNLNSEIGYSNASVKSGRMSGWQCSEIGKMEGSERIMSSEVQGVQCVRFSTSNCLDEGPSSCHLDPSCSYGEPLRVLEDRYGADRVQYLEKDRVELLRKLDELKEQLTRSCDVSDRAKEKVFHERMMAPPDLCSSSGNCLLTGASVPDSASLQFFTPDKRAAQAPYLSCPSEPIPSNHGHEMTMHGYHPSVQKSNYIPQCGDPLRPQTLERGAHTLPKQFQQPSCENFSGNYFPINPDPFEPFPSSTAFHQHSSSCYHCCDKHHRVPAPAPFAFSRFPDGLNNPLMYHHENSGAFAPHVHNSCATVAPPLNFHRLQSHTRWPSDLMDMGGFVRPRPRRVILASCGQHCRPIVGGAPFLTCLNCFELLQLPKKALLKAKNQQKIQCGACSTVITYAVINKKLVLSVNAEAMQFPTEVDDSSSEMIKDNAFRSHGHLDRINTNFSSDDYDNSGYDFQTIDTDPIASPAEQGMHTTKPQEMQSFHSSSPCTSEDEDSPDVLVAQREIINYVQQPSKSNLSPPPPGSPLQHKFDYSSNNHVGNRYGKGNRSSRLDQEKVMSNKSAARQNSIKDTSLATDMDVSFHEYSNTVVSQDSKDTGREESKPKINKGGESFFANIKKSLKDFSRSNQVDDYSRKVSINGHIIPDRWVKKAEKLSGPIHPGQYWYDFHAGFWGVMGGPCLGIIPPCIEEFKYSMPENCSGGNTGVFVNGRELHHKDLELLATRGLSTERDKSYIVEISGRVVDEDTGEELDSLGKLAPTVEKVKHGFGMRGPKGTA